MNVMNIRYEDLVEKGFSIPNYRGLIIPNSPACLRRLAEDMKLLAQDAALITTPNIAVPAELTSYFDPMVVQIFTGPRNANMLFGEVKKGDWVTAYVKFRVQEYTGHTTVYSDYADGAVSGVNENWLAREQYPFQTTIRYGDREAAVSAEAKINIASEKQRAAANTLAIDLNKFYLFGVEGKEIYGLLNDPNLNASITPGTAAGGSDTEWAEKTANEIYNDVISLSAHLKQNSMGLIGNNNKLVLAVSQESDGMLAKINELGLSVRQMLKNEFGDRLEIVQIPELYNATSGSTIMLMAKDILGAPVAQLAFGEKFRAHQPVRGLSCWMQKFSASTYGAIIYYPFAIATMEGV